MTLCRALCCIALVVAQPALALDPELPLGARLTAERTPDLDSFRAPVAAFDGSGVPVVEVEGQITRRAWRIASPGLTPLQVMVPLRAQLEALGYALVFECHATQCGGFDFRFETEVLPGPNMYVDITDYRYLTALRGDPADPLQAVGVLTSVTAQSAYVQIIAADARRDSATVLETEVPAPEAVSEPVAPAGVPAAEGVLATELLEQGHVVLGDLEFATGTSDLGEGPFASLAELAAVLGSDPSVRMVLVGHTDATGSREANVSVSRARAQSVRDRLVARFDIDPDRLEADGIAYLAPVAPNWTSEGRAQNRRVTAILLREN